MTEKQMKQQDKGNEAISVLGEAERLYSPEQVSAAYDRIAREIEAKLNGTYALDYLHATRYRGETSGSEIVWKVSPAATLEGRTVLVIDDILDEGHTLVAIQNAVRAQGVKALYTAVLADKQHGRRNPEARADFVGVTIPDRYVFGGGMDYKNHLRFAPGIYAVKGL
jgi:hypoxanthine phosphoribosyltransferase